MAEAKRLGALVAGIVRGARRERRAAGEEMAAALGEAVGPRHAGHVRLVAVRGGAALIEVDSPARLQELRTYAGGRILERLRREAPRAGIARLRFAVSGGEGSR